MSETLPYKWCRTPQFAGSSAFLVLSLWLDGRRSERRLGTLNLQHGSVSPFLRGPRFDRTLREKSSDEFFWAKSRLIGYQPGAFDFARLQLLHPGTVATK